MFKLRKKQKNNLGNSSNNDQEFVDYDYSGQEEFVENYDENLQNGNYNEEYNSNYNSEYDFDNTNANNFDEYNQRIAYYNQFENYRIPEEPNPGYNQENQYNEKNTFQNENLEDNSIYDSFSQESENSHNETEPTAEQYVESLVKDTTKSNQESSTFGESEKVKVSNRREKIEKSNHSNQNTSSSNKKSIKQDIEQIIENINKLDKTVEELNNNNSINQLFEIKFNELSEIISGTLNKLNLKVNSNLAINAKNSEVTLQLIQIMDDLTNSVEMNETEIKSIISEEIETQLKTFKSDLLKQNDNAFQNVINRISDKLDKRFDRFDASISSFDNEFEKISLTLTKSFTKEIEKFNKKLTLDIEKVNNDLTLNSNLAFEKISKILKESKRRNQEVSEEIENKFKSLKEYIINDELKEYDELTLSDTDIRVLKWLLSKEYAIQKEITKSNILNSLNYLANLNIIDFGWNDKIDELPVMAYWVSEAKGNRVRTLLGRWEFSRLGREFTTKNEMNNEKSEWFDSKEEPKEKQENNKSNNNQRHSNSNRSNNNSKKN